MVAVQSLSRVWLFATPWTAARQASLSFTISWSLLKLMSIESVMPSNHFIFCHPLLLLPSIFPSISIFSSESALRIRWPKYWSFSFSINLSNEYWGLISFRMDRFYLLVVHGRFPFSLADISACLRGFLVMWFRNPFSKIPKALTTGSSQGKISIFVYIPWKLSPEAPRWIAWVCSSGTGGCETPCSIRGHIAKGSGRVSPWPWASLVLSPVPGTKKAFIILSEDVREEKEPAVQMKLPRGVCVHVWGWWYFVWTRCIAGAQ